MMQLHYYDNPINPYHHHISSDPVRPNIPLYRRYAHNRGVFFLTSDNQMFPVAISCAAFIGEIPRDEDELMGEWDEFGVAVFYTVWNLGNYGPSKGAGRVIINKALNHIRWFKPFVKTVVTLSPKTEMARKFHLSNGATIYRENENTINYEYKL